MREILFRGKTKQGLWVCGFYFYSEAQSEHLIIGDSKDYGLNKMEIIPSTVGQYTGLTDKNGKMIFEGDKVAVLNPKPFARTTGTVVFIDGCFEVKFHREDYGRDYLKCLTCNRECEVIGNIYDNPELLKEEV